MSESTLHLTNIGPTDEIELTIIPEPQPGSIIVITTADGESRPFGNTLRQRYHCLVVFRGPDGPTMEVVPEDVMNRLGWFRK